MNILYALVIVVAAVVAIALFIHWRTVPTYSVQITDLPRVLLHLSASTSTPAYAMLTFSPPDKPGAENVVSLQFSLENGRPGFDWVLYQKRNIADEARFAEYARAAGFSTKPAEMNGVKYLRVESGDLVVLCKGVLTELYRVPPTAKIELIVEGFKWDA